MKNLIMTIVVLVLLGVGAYLIFSGKNVIGSSEANVDINSLNSDLGRAMDKDAVKKVVRNTCKDLDYLENIGGSVAADPIPGVSGVDKASVDYNKLHSFYDNLKKSVDHYKLPTLPSFKEFFGKDGKEFCETQYQ